MLGTFLLAVAAMFFISIIDVLANLAGDQPKPLGLVSACRKVLFRAMVIGVSVYLYFSVCQ